MFKFVSANQRLIEVFLINQAKKSTDGYNFQQSNQLKNEKIMKKEMKTLFVALGFLFLFIGSSTAQKVFSCQYKSDAKVKVYVAQYKSDADLVVYKCQYKSDASGNDGLWFFCDYKSDADKTIFFCDYKSDADLVIYFAEYKSDAGWKNSSKKSLLY
ncbi:MAG: DUF6150 family protein [Bacteroidota bacterium]